MRYFTPELYVRFNSPDDAAADRADEAWEAAIRDYHSHLGALRDQMPSGARQVTELRLHDAELLACEQKTQPAGPLWPPPSGWPLPPAWSAVAIVSVRQGSTINSLYYLLRDDVRHHPAKGDWPFSARRKHWLYDEVDLAAGGPGMLVHRILFSDGTVTEIPFTSVVIHTIALQEPDQHGAAKQTA